MYAIPAPCPKCSVNPLRLSRFSWRWRGGIHFVFRFCWWWRGGIHFVFRFCWWWRGGIHFVFRLAGDGTEEYVACPASVGDGAEEYISCPASVGDGEEEYIESVAGSRDLPNDAINNMFLNVKDENVNLFQISLSLRAYFGKWHIEQSECVHILKCCYLESLKLI